MKKTLFVGPIVLLAILLSLNTVSAQMGPGMMGRGYGMGHHMMETGYGRGTGMMGQGGYAEGYCAYCGSPAGSGMKGPGETRPGRGTGPGGGEGPGTMGRGYGTGPGYGYGPRYQQPQKALEEKDVKPILENYLKSTRNPNLKLGKIEDKESTFEAEIMTKDDSLVDKIAIDKNTGWMRSIY